MYGPTGDRQPAGQVEGLSCIGPAVCKVLLVTCEGQGDLSAKLGRWRPCQVSWRQPVRFQGGGLSCVRVAACQVS